MSIRVTKYYLDLVAVREAMSKKEIYTNADLARKAGMSPGSLSRPLSGKGPVSGMTLHSLCYVLDVTPDVIIKKETPVQEEIPVEAAKQEAPEGNVMLQHQLILRELKLQTELLEKIYSLWA